MNCLRLLNYFSVVGTAAAYAVMRLFLKGISMTRLGLLSSSALRSAVLSGFALAAATPAVAQQVPAETDAPQTLTSESEIESGSDAANTAQSGDTAASTSDNSDIIVTGSRIRRPNLESAVPVTALGGNEFFQTGQVSVGDVLNELPALRSTFSQSNSTLYLGTAGLSLLDLRGLGTSRTLVLINGRRHVASDILNSGTSVDINQVPTDLIERVEIVTGGNSAIYGSDAIAGVVNFVMKKDFQGIQIRGQGGISSHGDAGNYYISGLAGTNFADGRGNVAANVEYTRQNSYYGSGRKYYRNTAGFLTVDRDPASASSDGNPDRVFYQNYTGATLSSAGNVLFFNDGAYSNPFIFDPDGTLVELTGDRVGLAPYGSFLNPNRNSNLRSGKQLQLLPQVDRLNVNVLGHFTVSDAFEPFFEAKYFRAKTFGTGFSGPAFIQAGGTLGSPRERFSTSNPYLTDQARNVIRQGYGDYYGAYDADENPIGNGLNDADEFGFTLWENLLGLGVRTERATRETYRFVGGVRGTFNEDWSYEFSANYGQFKERTNVGGNLNAQRFLLSIDAVRDSSGNIVCRSQLDPTAAVAFESAGDPAYAAAHLAEDVAQCVPVNLFGEGNVSEAARNYITQDTVSRGKITQFVLNGFVSGDSSQWFQLPGGPVGFALGGEYRRETNAFEADPLIQAGMTFYNALPTFKSPSFEVKEVFGELRLPILKEVPFFHDLTVSGAGRVADYKGSTGTVVAWNVSGEWAPIKDIRFRGNYSRAVRAPNLSELYSTLGQNYAPGFADPCSLRNISSGSENREANCRAAGIPADYDFQYIQSLEILSGGNVNLREETANSLTLGAVFQPRFLPGFSLTVDYYDIKVNKVIASPTAQQIVDACYDAASLDNQFCDLIQRADASGGAHGEIQHQILEGTLAVTPLNYAALRVRGIDAEVAYRGPVGNGQLATRFLYTHNLQKDNFLNPVDPKRADQYLLEQGDPKDEFSWNTDYKIGPVTLGYQMRYIGKQLAISTAEYEYFFSKQDRPAQDPDWSDPVFAKGIFYHDVRVGLDVNKSFNFYVGVDNVTNRMPPFRITGVTDGGGIYNNIGRYFYAGAVAKF